MTRVTQAHTDARRQAIRDAAFQMFVRKGVEGARMEEIAAEAGLSAGAIYRYFSSKEDLLGAVLTFCVERNREFFDVSAIEDESPLGLLTTKARSMWDQLGTPASRDLTIIGLESALAGARSAPGIAEERRRLWEDVLEVVETLLVRAQAAGELRADISPRALAVTLLSIWLGHDVLSLDFGERLDSESTFAVVTELLRGLAPEPKEHSNGISS